MFPEVSAQVLDLHVTASANALDIHDVTRHLKTSIVSFRTAKSERHFAYGLRNHQSFKRMGTHNKNIL